MADEVAGVPGPGMHPGRPLSGRDREAQVRIFGGLKPDGEDAIALRDARGHHFQRLEWLGDAILDLLAAEHRTYATALGLECCRPEPFETTDRMLGRQALKSALATLADWKLTWHRAADLAEAAVGAAFRAHAWDGARHCAAVLHPPLGIDPRSAEPLVVGRRAACALGAQVFDTVVSIDLYSERPDDFEGALSELRAHRITNRIRAELAEGADIPRIALSIVGRANDLDEALGTVCLQEGLIRALDATRELIRNQA